MADKVLVPLSEVAVQFGSEDILNAWMKREGVEVTTDWAGRGALPTETAARLVSAYQREQQSWAAKHAAYQKYLERREAERFQVGEAAYVEAAGRQLELERRHGEIFINGQQTLSPAGRQVAREARVRALEEFDRKQKPPVSFEKFDG